MDPNTISAYDRTAASVAELHKGLVPSRIYSLIRQHFIPRGKCADIGCGSGRDTSWLASQGFDVTGIDASIGMLQHARLGHPSINFVQDSLPFLSGQADELYTNILCSAVIMHLPKDQITEAITNLIRIMRPGGVILLSFRGTTSAGERENGKLYTFLDGKHLCQKFFESGTRLLHAEVDHEEGRDLNWTTLVFKKNLVPAV